MKLALSKAQVFITRKAKIFMSAFSALKPGPSGQEAIHKIANDASKIVRRSHKLFLLLAVNGLVILAIWAGRTELDVVTRGSGQVVPALQNQFVQHLEGGIVEEILVTEGQLVRKGDVLMRVRDSFSKAEFQRASQQLLAESARLARLDAETSAQNEIAFSDDLIQAIPGATRDEAVLFEQRRSNLDQKMLILQDQLRRKRLEKREKQLRLENTEREFNLVQERVSNLEPLAQSGATSRNDLLRSKTELQQIRTKMGDLAHQIPQIDVELSELERRQDELLSSFVAEANEEKIKSLNRIEQLEATLQAMQDRNRRTEVRAPIDGKVHRLFQTTIGGVVQGGQNLAQLVPTDATVSVDIELAPKDRGRVWVDLPAIVKLSAYDYTVFGSIKARVTDISSDVLQDDQGNPYYRVKLEADTAKFADQTIVPGMAAEVDIITGKRTILDYLLAPIRDIQSKALREY